jgi:hypothetical protein
MLPFMDVGVRPNGCFGTWSIDFFFLLFRLLQFLW